MRALRNEALEPLRNAMLNCTRIFQTKGSCLLQSRLYKAAGGVSGSYAVSVNGTRKKRNQVVESREASLSATVPVPGQPERWPPPPSA